MKFSLAVLIAAVTVNCLVTAINGVAATDKVVVPYIDMLLPPLEDVQDNNSNNNKDAPASTAKATTVSTKTTTTTTTTTTTKKPITNEVNNILPELSIEALLPPLFEAKIEKEETKKTTTQKPTTTITTTRTTTTTTRRPTTTTTKATTTTTAKPLTTTTTTSSKLEVPELLLDPFLPPLLDNEIVDAKAKDLAVTTQKPIAAVKTTKKSYYQQQKDQHANDQAEAHTKNYQKPQQIKHLTASSNTGKNSNKPLASAVAATTTTIDKHVAETKTQAKQVSLVKPTQSIKLLSKIETMTKQHVAKQVTQHKHLNGNSQSGSKQLNNYSFDLYFGSTTPRPPKYGLPTITPFPHRLGR